MRTLAELQAVIQEEYPDPDDLQEEMARNRMLRNEIQKELLASQAAPPLQVWMVMIENTIDLLSSEFIRIMIADQPQEMVDQQAEQFADYIKTQRAIMLYTMMSKTLSDPASKLLIPKR